MVKILHVGRMNCSHWFTNHIHVSMVWHFGVGLFLRSYMVDLSSEIHQKSDVAKKNNLRCPHFWATIIDATFGWIDPKKVNSWIHPTVKSVELISWWKREKLLTFVERWDSKGGDNAENQGCLHAMRLESHYFLDVEALLELWFLDWVRLGVQECLVNILTMMSVVGKGTRNTTPKTE